LLVAEDITLLENFLLSMDSGNDVFFVDVSREDFGKPFRYKNSTKFNINQEENLRRVLFDTKLSTQIMSLIYHEI
jgi:hypothetical protein